MIQNYAQTSPADLFIGKHRFCAVEIQACCYALPVAIGELNGLFFPVV